MPRWLVGQACDKQVRCACRKPPRHVAVVPRYSAPCAPTLACPVLVQVFVQDAEVQGRYKLVAERLSRPGELTHIVSSACGVMGAQHAKHPLLAPTPSGGLGLLQLPRSSYHVACAL